MSADSLLQAAASAAAAGWSRDQIVARAARDIWDGAYVNLGIGMPQQVADHLAPGIEVFLHSENGILGLGGTATEENLDLDLTDSGKRNVTLVPGAATFDSSDSFGIVRGGHLDVAILGAMEVSGGGDIANWTAPGRTPGVGGAMDLVSGAKTLWVVMQHCEKSGRPKLVPSCSLPLTGTRVVRRVVTNLGVFEPCGTYFAALELAPGVTEDIVRASTGMEVRFTHGSVLRFRA
jgi:3-oxoacid CoA-transferase B subunit